MDSYPSIITFTNTGNPSAIPPRTAHLGEAQTVRRKVESALAEDARCRVPGVTDGIYELKDLAPFARLEHGVPMIRRVDYEGWPIEFQRAADVGEFRRRLDKAAPYLAAFDLKANGFCLAGGSVSALLMRSDESRQNDYGSFHDFDLFLVGHKTDDDARRAISALKAHLYKQWGGEGRTSVYRTQGCITFYSSDPRYPRKPADKAGGAGDVDEEPEEPEEPEEGSEEGSEDPSYGHRRKGVLLVQVILRRYSTLGEVIHGFDLGSSAVLWDGERVLTTALGKIAFENGANVLNLSARRNSYESRLARYFDRGFDLVLPGLDGCALASLGGRLPYLYAHWLKGGGCSCGLTALRLLATRPGHDNQGRPVADGAEAKAEEPPATSDYSAGGISYGNHRALASRNARALGGETVWIASLCAHAPLTPELDIFAIDPTVDPDEVADIVNWSFASGKVNVKTITALLGADRASDLMLSCIKSGGKNPPKEDVRRHSVERCAEINPKARIPFAFMAVEDKTALTGPFPRCLVTAEEWYGEAKAF